MIYYLKLFPPPGSFMQHCGAGDQTSLIGRDTPRAHEVAIIMSAKALRQGSSAQKDGCVVRRLNR